ncbi:DUF2269 family protein [Mesorhizobium sp. B2-4-14]|nr:DUF2269 family protein [Mesorhizobium sp. B2-4-14]
MVSNPILVQEASLSNSMIALLRAIHIVFGAFWMGGTVTLGFFLLPALRKGSTDGAAIAARFLAKSWFMTASLVAGFISVIAGLALYAELWAGTDFTGPAVWYSVGGHLAEASIILAVLAIAPTTRQLARFAQEQHDEERTLRLERLLNRVTVVSRVIAAMLAVTITMMAIGRYMG